MSDRSPMRCVYLAIEKSVDEGASMSLERERVCLTHLIAARGTLCLLGSCSLRLLRRCLGLPGRSLRLLPNCFLSSSSGPRCLRGASSGSTVCCSAACVGTRTAGGGPLGGVTGHEERSALRCGVTSLNTSSLALNGGLLATGSYCAVADRSVSITSLGFGLVLLWLCPFPCFCLCLWLGLGLAGKEFWLDACWCLVCGFGK